MVTLHRHLTHRHARRILSGEPRDLQPGEVRFFSFYAPSLEGGTHTVAVEQTISAPADSRSPNKNRRDDAIPLQKQSFYVVAPKFGLPAGIVDSVYPAPGGTAEVTVLPHIVLKDPHLPWERKASYNIPDETVPDKDKDGNPRNRTPWVALLVFTAEELRLEKPALDAMLTKLPLEVKREQSETLAVRMRARDTPLLSGVESVANAISFNAELDERDASLAMDAVLVPKDLFAALFTEPGKTQVLNVAKYKYLAHVREVATDGMAAAGAEADQAMFSIVLSHRTGPIGASVPTSTVVHLVSLDMPGNLSLPLNDKTTHVAMTSLHSWTYNCLPSNDFANSFSRLTHLGEKLNVLHVQPQMPTEKDQDAKQEGSPKDDDEGIAKLITKRQADGYTLVRHRTVTGEVTAAIIRGPLTPTFVPHPLRAGFMMQSNFGSDLQILDPDLSLMDITYSSAWSLGKTLAMGDEAFSTALARLRNAIHSAALDGAKKEVHAAIGAAHISRRDTTRGMLGLVEGLNALNRDLHENGQRATAFDANRWLPSHHTGEVQAHEVVDMSHHSPHISTRMAGHAEAAALSFALAADGTPYNEHNVPTNTDSAYILSWVIDKLHLANIPAHYLLPDPSCLPEETLRFFHVDENWTDALVDGALSLANHWAAQPAKDDCRTAIKHAINKALYEPDAKLGHIQMPKYGFLLRSQLLVQFPDISVSARFAKRPDQNQPAQAPILVQKRLSNDTMYCLFDRLPPEILGITFTLPPHQQCFTVGRSLSSTELAINIRRVYTTTDVKKPNDRRIPLGETLKLQPGATDLFDWPARTLNVTAFAKFQREKLQQGMGDGEFDDSHPTSALLAMQLNDSILQLDIGDPTAAFQNPSPPPRFQLSIPPRSQTLPPPLSPIPPPSHPIPTPFLRPTPPSTRNRLQTSPLPLSLTPPSTTADRPYYTLKIYPFLNKGFIPSNSPLPQDLIFSIRQRDGAPPLTRKLLRFIVEVPYGAMPSAPPASPADPPLTLLAADADPPMPSMLSNLRFNVLKRWDRGGKDTKDRVGDYLILEVVPRAKEGVYVRMAREASFLLPGVKVVGYSGAEARRPVVNLKYKYADGYGEPGWNDWTEVEVRPDPAMED
ncbi:hypothetical protein B0T22DRAFT_528582 [Podospora appendiculata]|uniref:Uncharacterized protein n=1 Tax=Podospora appendiculata TaxID=314037 RepID=A0AAE0XBT5_9PEZI|nr:hypothetical protein B0T22DRAFT_528582 [Podospora appendiculata]